MELTIKRSLHALVLIDISKAFHSIKRDILLQNYSKLVLPPNVLIGFLATLLVAVKEYVSNILSLRLFH